MGRIGCGDDLEAIMRSGDGGNKQDAENGLHGAQASHASAKGRAIDLILLKNPSS